jgi:hypothetical protein
MKATEYLRMLRRAINEGTCPTTLFKEKFCKRINDCGEMYGTGSCRPWCCNHERSWYFYVVLAELQNVNGWLKDWGKGRIGAASKVRLTYAAECFFRVIKHILKAYGHWKGKGQ